MSSQSQTSNGMNVCVFCSMYDVDAKYAEPAAEFGRNLTENGHSLVWGGTDSGLMKVVSDAVKKNGGKIVGITMEGIRSTARADADELVVAKNLSERKRLMLERADAFVLLPGGIGSFDEITEILELKKHNLHDKHIIILNTDGFYAGFRTQLERMRQEGFITRPLETYLHFADTPAKVLDILNGQ